MDYEYNNEYSYEPSYEYYTEPSYQYYNESSYQYYNEYNFTMDDDTFDVYCGDITSIMANICYYIVNNIDGKHTTFIA